MSENQFGLVYADALTENVAGQVNLKPVSYYNTLTVKGVDANRIGALGICGGGGYTIEVSKSDKRIKAVATVSAFNTGRVRHNGFKASQTIPNAQLVTVQGGGHWVSSDFNALAQPAIEKFLKE